jgi:predicted RNA-binding Zn ribbon-like protein
MSSPIRRGGRSGPDGYLFEITGGAPCLDLANTVDNRPTAQRRELLKTYKDLVDWGRQSGTIPEQVSAELLDLAGRKPLAARSALRRARTVREAIFDLFSELCAGRPAPPRALQTLNVALETALSHLRLEQENGAFAWRWDMNESPLDRVLWPAVRSAAELVSREERLRVRECAADRCGWLFLDRSKNGSRRWCDMTVCGNRAKARSYHARRRAARKPGPAGSRALDNPRRANR